MKQFYARLYYNNQFFIYFFAMFIIKTKKHHGSQKKISDTGYYTNCDVLLFFSFYRALNINSENYIIFFCIIFHLYNKSK